MHILTFCTLPHTSQEKSHQFPVKLTMNEKMLLFLVRILNVFLFVLKSGLLQLEFGMSEKHTK